MPAPVLVLGNGPVGQTTALLLARWGVPTVLLDRRPCRDLVGSKSIVQQRDVLDVWESVGAGRRIADEGLTWTLARTYYRDTELFSTRFPDRGRSPFPPFVNISQGRTEQILDERVAASPLVDARWGHDVTAIRQDDHGVEVTCTRENAPPVTLRGSHAVACTGARREVRDMLGVTFEGRAFDDRFLICDVRTDLPGWRHERRFAFDPAWNPGRQVLIHPCPDSVYRIDWQVPPEVDLAEEQANGTLDRRIRQIVGEHPYELVWSSLYRFQSRHASRFQVGRVLLAGDAAHLYAPFGARGLNSGVQDAENAAWKIAAVRHGWAPESLLETYDTERRAAALENLDVTSRTMDFLVPQSDEAREWRHDVLARAADDPAVRALVDSGRLAEPFWYVDSPLTTPDASRPTPVRPPKGEVPTPAPGVLVPDVPVRLPGTSGPTALRRLVRGGLLALTGPGVDASHIGALLEETVAARVRALSVPEVDTDDELAACLVLRTAETWLLRPDGHVAAVVPGGPAADEALRAAARRSLGYVG
ncbi:MAG: FAD-dependent monooxygenase [Actinomycetes bacterium]